MLTGQRLVDVGDRKGGRSERTKSRKLILGNAGGREEKRDRCQADNKSPPVIVGRPGKLTSSKRKEKGEAGSNEKDDGGGGKRGHGRSWGVSQSQGPS